MENIFAHLKRAVLIFVLTLSIISADELATKLEIWVYNYKNSSITITDSTFNTTWDNNKNLTSIFQNGSITVEANYHEGPRYKYGFDYVFTSHPHLGDSTVYDTLGYGLYKISTIWDTFERYFYLDIRDGNLPASPVDIKLKFGDGSDQWEYKHGASCNDTAFWHTITNGNIYTIWDIWDDCVEAGWTSDSPDMSPFQPIDPTNLSISIAGVYPKHPLLTWERSEPVESAKYNVWRKEEQSQWHEIASNLTTNSYLDEEVDIFGMGPQSTFYYKVRAVSGDGTKESNGYSNTESIMGVGPAERINISSQVIPNDFSLTTFPNPFNPTIKIAYTIPKEGKVSLLVYDIVGRGVSTLVSEYQLEGNYIMNWDAEDFPSGIYYIRLENAGSGITRKVLLVR